MGARVRLRRRALDLSQTALAEALGITFQQVQKYERGSNRVSASMLVKIAARLDTTVAALVGEDGQEPLEPDAYAQLAVPSAVELMTAYAQIKDEERRRALLQLAQGLARASAEKDRSEPAKRVAGKGSR